MKYSLAGILSVAMAASPECVLGQSSPVSVDEPQNAASQQPAQPGTGSSGQPGTDTSAPTEQKQLPDSPGRTQSQTAAPQSGSQKARDTTEHPLGTAAAEIGNATASTASKPAGVAIAPGKTHSSRSLLIKVGAVVGAAVALGTVMALSNSSPSRPPGAASASTPSR